MIKQVIHARLSEIAIKNDTRNIIRDLKIDKSYDQFLRELISIYQKNLKEKNAQESLIPSLERHSGKTSKAQPKESIK